MDVSDYCRDIETYRRKNDGHLIRIVGPWFDGLEVGRAGRAAEGGAERHRSLLRTVLPQGPRRRPVKSTSARRTSSTCSTNGAGRRGSRPFRAVPQSPTSRPRRHRNAEVCRCRNTWSACSYAEQPPRHRRAGRIGRSDPRSGVDRLDRVREKSGGLRGDERQATLARLADLDAELIALATTSAGAAALEQTRAEASNDLAPFRSTMAAAAVESAVERTAMKLLRERLGLPTITFF